MSTNLYQRTNMSGPWNVTSVTPYGATGWREGVEGDKAISLNQQLGRGVPGTPYLKEFAPGMGAWAKTPPLEPDPKDQLWSEYQTAFDEAKAANVQRYEQILQVYGQLRNRALEMDTGFGEEQQKRLQRIYFGEGTRVTQQGITSGLSGSTSYRDPFRPGSAESGVMQLGVKRQHAQQAALLGEQQRERRVGLMTGLEGDRLRFMERREDAYPNPALLAQLSQGLGLGSRAEEASGLWNQGQYSAAPEAGATDTTMLDMTLGFFGLRPQQQQQQQQQQQVPQQAPIQAPEKKDKGLTPKQVDRRYGVGTVNRYRYEIRMAERRGDKEQVAHWEKKIRDRYRPRTFNPLPR